MKNKAFVALGVLVVLVLAFGAWRMFAPHTKTLAEVKQDELTAEQDIHAEASVSPPPKHFGYRSESHSPLPCPSGIVNSRAAPLPAAVYQISNQYAAPIGNQCVNIYAGHSNASSKPVLVTVSSSLDKSSVKMSDVKNLTSLTGSVRIVHSAGNVLTVRDDKGHAEKCRVAPSGCALISPPPN